VRAVFVTVLVLTFLWVGTDNTSAVNSLPGANIQSAGITLTQDGTVIITTRLGETWCRHGVLELFSPTLHWPDGSITNQILIEDYGAERGQTRVIGPYPAGTRLIFELRPKTRLCNGHYYLSTNGLHARITRNSQDNWTISWEDLKDYDLNDLYVDVVVKPERIYWFDPVFIEEIIAERLPFTSNPHYKLPWPKGEEYQVRQIPDVGNHEGANAYDFGGSFVVKAPEKGLVLWVEDSFGEGSCDERGRSKANVIVLQTALDTQVTFIHLSQNSARVKIGDTVDQGRVLARSGNSGFTCGTHLHFEFQKACRDLKEVRELRKEFPAGTPTLRWSCPTKPYYSDGFYISGVYHERLAKYSRYTSDNR